MCIFDYQSGKSQGILIHVLGMNPVEIISIFAHVAVLLACVASKK